MAAPTSALTFQDLIIEVAEKLGIASYGASGDGVVAIPTDAHDLAKCKKHVNNAIRMFLADAPAKGWQWMKPVAAITLWKAVPVLASRTVTGVHSAGVTTLTSSAAIFYESMENKPIVITTIGTFTILSYTSATVVTVTGNATCTTKTFSIAADGDYTLPTSFGGTFSGKATYVSGSNNAVEIEWTDESVIRQWRSNVEAETGDPYLAAVRVMESGTPRRRWEIAVYPIPNADEVIEFPYQYVFDSLVSLTEHPPTPFVHDDTIKAACLAIAEKDAEGTLGPDWEVYTSRAVAASHRMDRLSQPKRLGKFLGGGGITQMSIQQYRASGYNRPTVTFKL